MKYDNTTRAERPWWRVFELAAETRLITSKLKLTLNCERQLGRQMLLVAVIIVVLTYVCQVNSFVVPIGFGGAGADLFLPDVLLFTSNHCVLFTSNHPNVENVSLLLLNCVVVY